ncbi:MAG TPA: YiiD C-terminal domain-containing protein [Ktedonobacterales bacterium]|jgi:acyl-coenzyme A thioesterase PaaI-like protein
MADLETVSAIMTQAVPFNRVLGLEFIAVEAERAEVVLPEAPERLNHVGTIHAAAQFGLGEAASGAMVMAAFADLQGEGYIPLAASAQIAYRKPSKGDLRGVATLSIAEQERVRAEVQTNGKARFSVPVQLLDAQGVVTTEITVEWALIKPRAS